MVELADIFGQYGPAYRDKFGEQMPLRHRQVMWAIEHCRTDTLGGHVYQCPECGERVYRYHSCRDRHCPKCQGEKAYRWLAQQHELLLPVPYFMLTFTLPDELAQVARSHPAEMYDVLFRASAAATQQLALDPRFVGGQLGMVGILHTWGRTLTFHPHIHYLIPAGGLAADGQTWLPARENFLLPVKALSVIFRAKVRDALRETEGVAQIPAEVWEKDWVVHCQPVGNGQQAFKYLAPYVFRVAISNGRLVSLENAQVTFRYRDSRTGQAKLCTLDVEEFIRRFLQHVLPKGFVKVRYYGFLSPGHRPQLALIRQQLTPAGGEPLAPLAGLSSEPLTSVRPYTAETENATPGSPPAETLSDTPPAQPSADLDEEDELEPLEEAPTPASPTSVVRCPICGGVMRRQASLPSIGCAPP
jgi:Putative transposase/Transposase zinc-binding domain